MKASSAENKRQSEALIVWFFTHTIMSTYFGGYTGFASQTVVPQLVLNTVGLGPCYSVFTHLEVVNTKFSATYIFYT